MHPSSTAFDHRHVAEDACKNYRAADAISGNAMKVSRPPPRVPTGIIK